MKFIVLGTSDFTLCCASALLDNDAQVAAIVSMPISALPQNSADIARFAIEQNLPYHEFENINSAEAIEILQHYSSDFFLSSWPRMLGKDVLAIPNRYVVGTHPTELPFNRGRHPLHWTVVQGITETKLSFFHMDDGVDTGDILLQVPVAISPDDFIDDVTKKVNKAAYDGTQQLYERIVRDPKYDGIGQNHTLANYWRKRNPHDIILDFRMSSEVILQTVQSFASPYPCAKLIFRKHLIKINRASLASTTMSPSELQRIEPGRIISIDLSCSKVRIMAADRVVELECLGRLPGSLLKAKYIYPPSKYVIQWPMELDMQLNAQN
jgi:methionyl-tRNA formyltransferase